MVCVDACRRDILGRSKFSARYKKLLIYHMHKTVLVASNEISGAMRRRRGEYRKYGYSVNTKNEIGFDSAQSGHVKKGAGKRA